MVRLPVILILSEGQIPTTTIVNNIRKVPEDEEKETILNEPQCCLSGYVFHVITKYYKTDVFLVPYDKAFETLPNQIQESTEAVLIYFDSGKRNFLNRIPLYAEFLKSNNIELGILLCGRIYDDSNEGITYKEAKQESKLLDVIELDRTREDDEEEDPHDPLGYDELLQALRSFIWSNVKVGAGTKSSMLGSNSEALSDEDEELALFEDLTKEISIFKRAVENYMTRSERLAHIQHIFDKLEQLIIDCPSSSDEEN